MLCCVTVFIIRLTSVLLRLYYLHFPLVVSDYVIPMLLNWLITVWFHSYSLTYGVELYVEFRFTGIYCFCILFSCDNIYSMYSIYTICIIVSVDTV